MIKLGAHTSFSNSTNYLVGAVESSIEIGANTMMIFIGSPQTTRRVSVEKMKIIEYKNSFLSKAIPPKDIIIHGPYIVNLANKEKQHFAISFLTKDANLAEKIGAKYMVLHPGSSGNYDIETSLRTCAETIKAVIKNTKNINIAIETMAGKGKEIGITFEQLKTIIDEVNSNRVGICLDTCHIWDAGYNVKEFDKVLEKFDRIIGIDKLTVVHLNDSKNDLNSHKDRHANIGKGFIGLDALREIVHNPKLDNINIILETPKNGTNQTYKKEIAMLLEKG